MATPVPTTPPPASGRRRPFATVLLVILPVSLVLLVAELLARGFGLEVPGVFSPISAATCMQRSPLLGIEFAPNCSGHLAKQEFHTNSLGLRGAEIRDDDSLRVLAVGDSCTFGYNMTTNETYPYALQSLLDQRAGPGRYQVINAGVPGYTSHHGLLYLSERGFRLDPAVVIIGFEFNDNRHAGEVEGRLAQARRLKPLVAVDDFLMTSTLYRWVRLRSFAATVGERPSQVTPARFSANLERMIQLSRDHHAWPIILDWGLFPPYGEVMARIGEEQHVPVVAYDGPRLGFPDFVHPTPRGNLDVAMHLMATIESQGPRPGTRRAP